ncbi:MAG: hypothetical protein AB1607_05490 [Chloroflexota bacterium]
MSRLSRISMCALVFVFLLACSLITNPINQVQDTANTAQAIASDAVALATQAVPFETLIANPTVLAFGDIFNPQGAPVTEWNGIPVMPQATAGEEVTGLYSYKANATNEEATEFYTTQLTSLGWSEQVREIGETTLLYYVKDQQGVTITIAPADTNSILIWLVLQ